MNLFSVLLIYIVIYLGQILYDIDPFIPFMVLLVIHTTVVASNIFIFAYSRRNDDMQDRIAKEIAKYHFRKGEERY